MILLLEAAADAAPERTAVSTPEGSASYGELVDSARRVAVALRRRAITRFAIAEPDAGRVVALLAGAALAGAEACQYQPDTDTAELAAQAAALGHAIVVTRREDVGEVCAVIHPQELVQEASGAAPSLGPESPQPVMIRTTGTTGAPKAARHDWRVLAQTVAAVPPSPEQRWLLAYAPHQFAGVQVLLHVLASQATLVAPFPRQPRDGLQAVLSNGVTCVSATPTFWRFLLAEARSRDVRLPPLDQITLGGEASPPDLLEAIRTAFPFARVSQVYASTEFGSITSVRDGMPGLALEALWSKSNPRSNVRVEKGELWVRAETGMLGYADESDESGEPGKPGAVTAVEAGAWRPTGDLVEIVGRRVLFRGRQSEVINVGGVKVHPLPIEERILALECVEAARVFGRASKLTGSIVAVDVVPVGGVAAAAADKIRLEVRDAVADLSRAAQPRSIRLVDTVQVRGGKTVRSTEA